jgi:hypothetical protein
VRPLVRGAAAAAAAFHPAPHREVDLQVELHPVAAGLRRSQQPPPGYPGVEHASGAPQRVPANGVGTADAVAAAAAAWGGAGGLDESIEALQLHSLDLLPRAPGQRWGGGGGLARSRSVPAGAWDERDGGGPILAVESAFIYPAGATTSGHGRAADQRTSGGGSGGGGGALQHTNVLLGSGGGVGGSSGLSAFGCVSESLAALWARPCPQQDALRRSGASDAAAAAAAAAATRASLDLRGSGAAAAAAADDRAAAAAAPLDLPGLAARNTEKLRLLSSIDLEGPGSEGGAAALDAFLMRFVARSGAGAGPGGATGSGGGGAGAGPSISSGGGGGGGSSGGGGGGLEGGLAAASRSVDALDRELGRLGLSARRATAGAESSSGRGELELGPGGSNSVRSAGGGGPAPPQLSTSISSFACRLARPPSQPPVGVVGLMLTNGGGGLAGGAASAVF